MQTFADQRVAIGTRLWICSYRARRLLSSNVIVKCDFFFYVESNSDFDFQQFAHWVQLSSFLVLGSLFHLFQVVLCCIGISHSFPALTNVLFPLIFFFCYAGFKSFDWWPIDWANLSYSLQCAFPPHSAYRMSVRVFAGCWYVIQCWHRLPWERRREETKGDLTSCWTDEQNSCRLLSRGRLPLRKAKTF